MSWRGGFEMESRIPFYPPFNQQQVLRVTLSNDSILLLQSTVVVSDKHPVRILLAIDRPPP